jgi:hypothetical protein
LGFRVEEVFSRSGAFLSAFLGDMVLKAKPAGQCGNRYRHSVLPVCVLALAICGGMSAWSQQPAALGDGIDAAISPAAILDGAILQASPTLPAAAADSLSQWEGLPVQSISFKGIATARLAPLPGHLAQAEGAPLRSEDLKKSLRQLFATGLYEDVQVTGSREQSGVAIVFVGTPRTFIGTVSVDGAKGGTGRSLYPGQVDPGARTDAPDHDRKRLPLAGDYPNPHAPSR